MKYTLNVGMYSFFFCFKNAFDYLNNVPFNAHFHTNVLYFFHARRRFTSLCRMSFARLTAYHPRVAIAKYARGNFLVSSLFCIETNGQ